MQRIFKLNPRVPLVLFGLSGVLSLSLPLAAQENSGTLALNEDRIDQSSSRAARSDKIGGVGLRAGTIVSVAFGGALDLFWQANPDLQVGLFVGSGGIDLKDDINDDDDGDTVRATRADVNGSLALIQARYFVGNSFFVGGGLGQRKIAMDLRAENWLTEEYIDGEINAESTVVHFTLGNLWTWDWGLSIGADWFAVSVPIASSSSTNDIETSAGLDPDLEEIREDGEDAADELGQAPSFQLALFHIGYTF